MHKPSRIASQYDLFQASLEKLDKERKYLNYGFTISGRETYEERQERLCLEVFCAAGIQKGHVVVDVGFGSGEQDFLLARTREFDRLIGFNIAEKQVRYAAERARREGLSDRLSFRSGEAEVLPGIASNSVDRLIAIECAFYFDRPRFYRRAWEALKTGGLMVLADISLSDRLAFMNPGFGTQSANRAGWEKHFTTLSVRNINRETRPGAQKTVFKIAQAGLLDREWMEMAFYSQLIAIGLRSGLVRYDLIVLEKGTRADAPRRSSIVE